MFEKTEETYVDVTFNIWAIPRTLHEIKASDDSCPFYYKVFSGYSEPYQDGAIKLHESEHSIHLPEGIPLLERAIETLKAKIEEIQHTAMKEVATIQARIDSLALIEYHPEPLVMSGDMVVIEDGEVVGLDPMEGDIVTDEEQGDILLLKCVDCGKELCICEPTEDELEEQDSAPSEA